MENKTNAQAPARPAIITVTIEQLRTVTELCGTGYEFYEVSSDGCITLNEIGHFHLIYVDQNGRVETAQMEPYESPWECQ
jgi:hypothetical protein